jgi:hypothetical protein
VVREGEALKARSESRLSAKAGPITVFRFEQTCDETWANGVLQDMRCTTLKDGKTINVSIDRTGEGLQVRAPGAGSGLVSAEAMPTSWWTRASVSGADLIDTQDGKRLPAAVTRVGRETIDVGGVQVATTRYRVKGTLTADLWYDDAGRWVRCAFKARGQSVEMRLKSPLDSAPT